MPHNGAQYHVSVIRTRLSSYIKQQPFYFWSREPFDFLTRFKLRETFTLRQYLLVLEPTEADLIRWPFSTRTQA